MNILERTFQKAQLRWKVLRFLRLSAALGCAVLLLLLSLGAGILTGWPAERSLATTFLCAIAALGLLGLCLVAVKIALENRARSAIAADLERADTRLRDRLNTLCFLEPAMSEPRIRSFTTHIQRQTRSLLARAGSPAPYSLRQTLLPVAAFCALAIATAFLFQKYRPWSLLAVSAAPATTAANQPDRVPEPPLTNTVEAPKDWGEVRITDPGADLKVTKVDVVSLQVEAAANQPLTNLAWYSAVNGAGETPHPLSAAGRHSYVVSHTEVYLDELELSDWDVVTYYAKATTAAGKTYASEVYFLEVRPFREDILKMPGGEGGKPAQTLEDISGLVQRQQHVIRETHRYVQRPAGPDAPRAQERRTLADAERQLAEAARHLYGKMASEMEHMPIGEALDNLGKAGQSLQAAGALLEQDSMEAAQNQERKALLELTAARKVFQKAVSDDPGQFREPDASGQPPVADSQERLDQIAEFRNEAAAAKDFVQRSAARQKQLAADAERTAGRDQGPLAERQEQLQRALRDFQRQHPRSFAGAEGPAGQAQQAMAEASNALRNRQPRAAASAAAASRRLDELSQALQEKELQQQLADAYKLRQMLEKEIRELDARTRPPQQTSSADAAALAERSRRILDELKKKAEQAPTRQAFGEPLRDALSDPNHREILDALAGLQQSREPNAGRQLAARARDGMETVNKAFEQSAPKPAATPNGHAAPDPAGGLQSAIASLEALLHRERTGKKLPGEQERKQLAQALSQIRQALGDLSDPEPSAQGARAEVERLLGPRQAASPAELRRLLQAVQRLAAESSDTKARREAVAELTNIDPAQLPAAYRERIYTYLKKLSEP